MESLYVVGVVALLVIIIIALLAWMTDLMFGLIGRFLFPYKRKS